MHMVCIEAIKESGQSGTASFKGVAETLASKVIRSLRDLNTYCCQLSAMCKS